MTKLVAVAVLALTVSMTAMAGPKTRNAKKVNGSGGGGGAFRSPQIVRHVKPHVTQPYKRINPSWPKKNPHVKEID
jgi:hypothetical protein